MYIGFGLEIGTLRETIQKLLANPNHKPGKPDMKND